MYSEEIIKLVEAHLYSYLYFENKIAKLKEKYSINENDINSWIKSKGKINKGAEVTAINNIMLENEIQIEIRWQYIIKKALEKYNQKDEQEKLNYIRYKYFEKCSTTKIENKMAISRPTQSRIKADIIYYLALFAVKEDLISIESLKDGNNSL